MRWSVCGWVVRVRYYIYIIYYTYYLRLIPLCGFTRQDSCSHGCSPGQHFNVSLEGLSLEQLKAAVLPVAIAISTSRPIAIGLIGTIAIGRARVRTVQVPVQVRSGIENSIDSIYKQRL